jgi:small-conductance mechanosensitive channel
MPTLATLVLVLGLAWLASRALDRVIHRLRALGHFTPIMAERIQNIRRVLVWSIAVLTVLQATGMFSHAWALLSAVLAAVAIGFFAAWSLISNLTSALLIVALRPFRLGDYVELVEPNNGTALGGEVVDMNLVFTVLAERNPETGAEARLYIPNNLFVQKLVRTRRRPGSGDRDSFFGENNPP